MSKLKDSHIVPGRIAYLSNESLRAAGSCETDAALFGSQDSSVNGDHSFLILKVDSVNNRIVATPLLSGNSLHEKYLPLDNKLKSNFPRDSAEKASYFYSEQFWLIPLDVLKEASGIDKSPNSYRRGYAVDTPSEIARILTMFEMNGIPIRPVRRVGPPISN